MTTTYHTAIAAGAAANASVFNAPLGQLDAHLDDAMTFAVNNNAELVAARSPYTSLDARLDALVLAGGNVATLTNGVANAGQKVVTVDSSTGFIDTAYVAYALVGGAIEYNQIDSIDSPTQITLTTNVGTGGIANDTYFAMISSAEYARLAAIDYTACAFVDTGGSDTNGTIGRPDRAFATINAALDALAAVPDATIYLGIGAFSPIRDDYLAGIDAGSKLRDNLTIIGAKRPVINAGRTALETGSIIQGPLVFQRSGIELRNLGIDSGSDVCTALYAGVAQEGLAFVNILQANPETYETNIHVDNCVAICKAATSAVHAMLFECVENIQVSNIETCYGIHGVVFKARFGTIDGILTQGHTGESLIFISNTYSDCNRLAVSNVVMRCATAGDSGGVKFDTSNAGSTAIYGLVLSNIYADQLTYGLNFAATNAEIGSIYIENWSPNALSGAELTRSGANLIDASISVNGGFLKQLTPTLQNNWVDLGLGFAPMRYYKQGARVFLQGYCKSGTDKTSIFTLATGYRPAEAHLLSTVHSVGGVTTPTLITVNTNGTIVPVDNVTEWLSLDGLSFYVGPTYS